MNRLIYLFCATLMLSLACKSKDPSPNTKAETKAETKESAVKTSETSEEGAAKPVKKRVYFTNIKEGDSVKSPIKLSFGVDGMGVRPAGEDANDKTTGHHHLIIDSDGIAAGQVVPMNAQHIHYGKGQTSAEITLKPGQHTLRLQFADGIHRSYGPEMSAAIKVTVTE